MIHYELTYITTPDFTSDEIVNYHEKISSLVDKQGGEVQAKQKPTKKTLCYPIEKHQHGYLASVAFKMEKETLPKLEEDVKKERKIIRYIIVKKKKVKEAKERQGRKKKTLKPLGNISSKEKTTLQDLDAKIEEML